MASKAPRLQIESPAGKPPLKPGGGKNEPAGQINLPRRAAPSEHQASSVPELNDYIRARLPKGEVANFTELERALGELRSTGDKGHKMLLSSVLPRLSQFEGLPPALIPQLIQLSDTDDRRLVRFTFYLLQLLLGPGAAGTPSPSLGGSMSIRDLPKDLVSRAWQGVESTTTDVLLVELKLRTLSAAARSADGLLDRELVAALGVAASRAGDSSGGLGFVPTGKKAAQKAQSDTWELQRVTASIARASLSGKSGREAALKAFWGMLSPESVGARHATALAAIAMRADAVGTLKQEKTLADIIVGAAASYSTSPLSGGTPAAPAKGIAALSAVESQMKLGDKWVRVSLARLCAAVVYGEWNSVDKFVRGPGQAFWRLLLLLATRDVDALVALEACKALMGCLPSASGPLGGATPPEDAAKDARMRGRAWGFVATQAAPEGSAGEAASGGETLLGVVCARVRKFLASPRQPVVCAACRCAAALFEAQARVSGRGNVSAEALRAVQGLSGTVAALAMGPSASTAVRCTAMEAILWTQGPNKPPVLAPEDLLSSVASGGPHKGPWSPHLLQPLLTGVARVLRTTPLAAPALLATAAAIACGAPCHETAGQLTDLWSAALAQGAVGKAAALDSARSVLNQGLSLTPKNANAGTGSQLARNRIAQQDVAWLELAKGAAWWLGEYANVATGEFVGNPPPSSERNSQTGQRSGDESAGGAESALVKGSGGDIPAEMLALQSDRNAALAAVVASLQQAFLLLPWPGRSAAALALAKIAVRSDEPFRLQCYGFLSSLAAPGLHGSHDVFGVASVIKAPLATLDAVYSTQTVLQALTAQYGKMPHKWPPSVLKQLRDRSGALFTRIERTIGSMQGATYHPLGMLSRELLASGLDRAAVPLPGLQPTSSMPSSPFALTQTAAGAAAASPASPGAAPLLPQPSAVPESVPSTPLPGSPSLFSVASVDPLSQLVKGLDTRIQQDTFPPRQPFPWETSFVQEPTEGGHERSQSFAHERGQSFGGYSDMGFGATAHSRTSSQDNVHYVQGRGVVQHPFEGQLAEELTVYRGEEVEVEAEVDGWLHCISSRGAKGLVPATYVRMLAPGEHAAPASPPPRSHSRKISYDFFSQDDPLAAFTKPEAPPAWTTFEGYDEGGATVYDSQPSVEVLGEDPEEGGQYEDDYSYDTTGGAAPQESDEGPLSARREAEEEPEYVHVEAGDAADKVHDDSEARGAREEDEGARQVTRVPSLGNWASSTLSDKDSQAGVSVEDASANGARQASLEAAGSAQVPHGGLLSSIRHMSPGSRNPSIDGGQAPPSPHSLRGSRHSRTSSFDSAAVAGNAQKPRVATVLHTFEAETEDELSVGAGEELVVLQDIDGWLQVHRVGEPDKVGFIPSAYASAVASEEA
ncbi:hypothetical protein WJX73_004152 [Symbiochloris irregularis]|uniref:SH3 domain-containing protein n=1 Tax=Symbiochloris irregularis TaxID=706552 RepID=A0AAW1NTR3_9CHLO